MRLKSKIQSEVLMTSNYLLFSPDEQFLSFFSNRFQVTVGKIKIKLRVFEIEKCIHF